MICNDDILKKKMFLLYHIFKRPSLVHPFQSPELTFMEWIQDTHFLLKEIINTFLLFELKRVLTAMNYWRKERNPFLDHSLGFMNLVSLLLQFLSVGNKTNVKLRYRYLRERIDLECCMTQNKPNAKINNPKS